MYDTAFCWEFIEFGRHKKRDVRRKFSFNVKLT